jgi:DNA-binding response OmpR family regulator
MPGISGLDLARKITRLNPAIRVLFMSGYTDNVIGHGGILESGIALLQKPFTPRGLKEKIREVLNRAVSTV